MRKPNIIFMTDFGLNWGVVASMHGVCKQVDPDLQTYDLSHTIPEYNTLYASSCLQYTMPFWPKGSIFVSVVDPGVGTARRACVAKTADGYFVVTPDNGTLTHLAKMVGISEVREIDETVNRYPGTENVAVFHGRDLFAYCAARLASGIIGYEGVGPAYPVAEIVTHKLEYGKVSPGHAEGGVDEVLEKFGNISTNILIRDFETTGIHFGDMLRVVIYNREAVVADLTMPYQKSFGYVGVGEPVLFNDLASFMALGLNQRSMARAYGIEGGEGWRITVDKL